MSPVAVLAVQCIKLGSNHSEKSLAAYEALVHLGQSHLTDKLPLISRKDLKNYRNFNSIHPDYGDGITSQLFMAHYHGVPVIIKQATKAEAELAWALSQLHLAPRFFGLAEHCSCYIMEYVPEAVVIKKNRLDRRLNKFLLQGFRLQTQTQERIVQIIELFAQMGLSSRDFNFLVDTRSQRVYLIDPDPRYFEWLENRHQTSIVTRDLIKQFQDQFSEIDQRSRAMTSP